MGGIFSALIGLLAFVFWIVLMVKAYQGERYRVPLAGEIAEAIHQSTWKTDTPHETEAKDAAGISAEKKRTDEGIVKKPMVAVKSQRLLYPHSLGQNHRLQLCYILEYCPDNFLYPLLGIRGMVFDRR